MYGVFLKEAEAYVELTAEQPLLARGDLFPPKVVSAGVVQWPPSPLRPERPERPEGGSGTPWNKKCAGENGNSRTHREIYFRAVLSLHSSHPLAPPPPLLLFTPPLWPPTTGLPPWG